MNRINDIALNGSKIKIPIDDLVDKKIIHIQYVRLPRTSLLSAYSLAHRTNFL